MKKIILIAFFTIAVSTFLKAQEQTYTKAEEKLIDTISKLKEVKEREAYVVKQTNGKRHLSFMISEEPTKDSPYYGISVMEDNGGATYTHFHFFIHPKTFKIRYLEPVTGETVDLELYRKLQKSATE